MYVYNTQHILHTSIYNVIQSLIQRSSCGTRLKCQARLAKICTNPFQRVQPMTSSTSVEEPNRQHFWILSVTCEGTCSIKVWQVSARKFDSHESPVDNPWLHQLAHILLLIFFWFFSNLDARLEPQNHMWETWAFEAKWWYEWGKWVKWGKSHKVQVM